MNGKAVLVIHHSFYCLERGYRQQGVNGENRGALSTI